MSIIKIKQIDGLQTTLNDLITRLESGSLKSTYQQPAHGFSPGNVIAFLDGSWVLADASTAEKLGRIVVESVTANDFVAVQVGTIEISAWGLSPGKFYVVDETGNGTIAEFISNDSPNFAFNNPVIQAITSEKAHVLPWRPSAGVVPLAQGQEHTQNTVSLVTSGQGSSTGISLDYTPFSESTVQVHINGIAIIESYGNKTGEAYFSNDGGATAALLSEISAGSIIYWNAVTANYELNADDKIQVTYDKSNLD
jgi:hypothetical protein